MDEESEENHFYKSLRIKRAKYIARRQQRGNVLEAQFYIRMFMVSNPGYIQAKDKSPLNNVYVLAPDAAM